MRKKCINHLSIFDLFLNHDIGRELKSRQSGSTSIERYWAGWWWIYTCDVRCSSNTEL